MKKIIFMVLALMFVFSFTVLAQTEAKPEATYKVGDVVEYRKAGGEQN